MNAFSDKSNNIKLVKFPISNGIWPDKRLFDKLIPKRLLIDPSSDGIEPERVLFDRSRYIKLVN